MAQGLTSAAVRRRDWRRGSVGSAVRSIMPAGRVVLTVCHCSASSVFSHANGSSIRSVAWVSAPGPQPRTPRGARLPDQPTIPLRPLRSWRLSGSLAPFPFARCHALANCWPVQIRPQKRYQNPPSSPIRQRPRSIRAFPRRQSSISSAVSACSAVILAVPAEP